MSLCVLFFVCFFALVDLKLSMQTPDLFREHNTFFIACQRLCSRPVGFVYVAVHFFLSAAADALVTNVSMAAVLSRLVNYFIALKRKHLKSVYCAA